MTFLHYSHASNFSAVVGAYTSFSTTDIHLYWSH